MSRAREAQARQVELDMRTSPPYPERTGWTIHGNTSGFEAGDQLNVRSADGREGISRVVSTDNSLFNIDPIRWEQWRGAVNSAGATLSPELIERAVARGLESFGRPDDDIWNPVRYGRQRDDQLEVSTDGVNWTNSANPLAGAPSFSFTRVGNEMQWSVGAAEGSVENPYKLEFGTGQLIARKEGWYAFSHLPEWIVQLETGIVEFDDNDFPKYVLDRKRV